MMTRGSRQRRQARHGACRGARWFSHRDLVLAIVALFFAVGAARAEVPEITSGTLLIGGAPTLELATQVDIAVAGMVATVRVSQRFRNDGEDWLEGLYAFPLPPGAAVRAMRMEIDGRRIEAVIREREAAREAYEAARRDGRRAGVVDQATPNLFTTRVANIPPREEIAVTLTYVEVLDYADGAFGLRFPLTRTPRYGERGIRMPAAGPPPEVVLTVELEPGFDIAHLATPGHPATIVARGRARRIELAAPVAADRDFELVWEPRLAAAPVAALLRETHADADYALLMMLPPAPGYDRAAPRELVLVLDKSGSMEGDPMAQARESLMMAIGSLRPEDRFNVIAFDGRPRTLFEAPVDATAPAITRALDWIEALEADGGTEMGPALELAMAGRAPEGFVRQIVFVTDGAVGNETALFAQIAAALGEARLFTVGIGAAPNAWFMRKAAAFGRGSAVFIGAQDQVGERMDRLLRRLERPVLTAVRAGWPGSAEAHPADLPDLYAGEPLLVAARLDPAGGREVRLRGERPEGRWEASVDLGAAHPGVGVATLWARRKVEGLMDDLVLGADEGAVRAAVTRLGLDHGLVTRYTSLVAVDHAPVRPDGAPLEAAAVAGAAPRGTVLAEAVAFLPQTDAGTVMRMTLGAFALLLAWVLRLRLSDAA